MISPYETNLVRDGKDGKIISFGQSSMGYDIRLADEFKIFTNVHTAVIDPKNVDEKAFVTVKGSVLTIPPNSFALGYSVEEFSIPNDVLCLVIGKSSYARCGIIVCCTPAEPGWTGHLTIEISNTTPLPAKVYANEGIAQCLFFRSSEPCKTSYAERNGKYQGQGPQVVLPRL
jgi:dCTP deaminase